MARRASTLLALLAGAATLLAACGGNNQPATTAATAALPTAAAAAPPAPPATPRPAAPMDKIFGAASGPRLNLVTCDRESTFDRNRREYANNIVVFAEPKP